MALKAIKTFDVGSGAWKELAVIWGSKAGFFSVGQMSEAAGQRGELVELCRRWKQNFP